jgi:putative flippase GtrA
MLIALIPAYNPTAELSDYLARLKAERFFQHIILVNDGSRPECEAIFKEAANLSGVILLKHAFNQGKGAALKTGLNYIACEFPDHGVVTIDADGQHTVTDACRVGEALVAHPHNLIIGGRTFGDTTPLRSWIGNFFTRHIFRFMTGLRLFDTQSGLRGIPAAMIKELLRVEARGYEFELDMLMRSTHWGFPIIEVPIETVYLEGNKHSSFRPLWDSLRIYFVLFRFTLIAILSALLDYGIFISIYYGIHPSVFLALAAGRVVSTTFNYLNVRHFAFRTRMSHWKTLPKYLLLASFSGLMAWLLITGFMVRLHWHVVFAKVVAEVILFVVNFLVQRDLIFKRTSL